MTLRLIEGGRGHADAPGLLDPRRLAGRDARGRAAPRRRPGRPRAARRGRRRRTRALPRRPSSPAGRAGSSASGRATAWRQGLEAGGYPLSRFARLDADGGVVTPGPHRSAHPPAVRRQPRGRARAAPARRGLHGHPRGRRRDPVHGRGDPRSIGRGALGPRPPLAGRDGRHGVTTVEAKSGYGLDLADGAAPPRGRGRAGQGGPGRRRARRSSAPTPSRPSSVPAPTAPRPTSAT